MNISLVLRKWRMVLLLMIITLFVTWMWHSPDLNSPWDMFSASINTPDNVKSSTDSILKQYFTSLKTKTGVCSCTVLVRHDGRWKPSDIDCPDKHNTVKTNLKTMAGNVPIYVYPKQTDIFVSRSIIEKGSWEPELVKMVTDIMTKDKTMDFLDIGANLGVYALTLAKIGKRVVAVEALPETAKNLCRSVQEAKFTGFIPLIINNAISNKRSRFSFGFNKGNVGATYIIESTNKSENLKNSVESILLDDVLEIFPTKNVFMKIDAERHEIKILEGAKRFFTEVNVKYILMEMLIFTDMDLVRAEKIIQFLKNKNMKPFTKANLKVPLNPDSLLRKGSAHDILWCKS